jgi:hypothetical protein
VSACCEGPTYIYSVNVLAKLSRNSGRYVRLDGHWVFGAVHAALYHALHFVHGGDSHSRLLSEVCCVLGV